MSSSRQAEAIAQLTEVTGGGCSEETAREMLEGVDWDVQRAAELIFDGAAPPPRRRMERFEVEDPPYNPPNPISSSSAPSALARALAFPFRILFYPLRALAAVLLPRSAYATLAAALARLSPAALVLGVSHLLFGPPAPRRDLLRQLEEDTGAVPYTRWLNGGGDAAAATGAEAGPGPATAQRRGARALPPAGAVLPDFQAMPYDALLARALTEARIACVVLISSEHDDVPAFIRTTLTDPAFVKALHDHGVLTWIGDARMRDGWQAVQKLAVTTYPSVIFLAPQPAARGAPALRILSRHSGVDATSSTALTSHLTGSLVPRAASYLEQLRTNPAARQPAPHAELAAARRLRAEQDAAFAASAARDRDRILGAMAAEREAGDRARAEAEAAAAAELQVQGQAVERAAWRIWARREVSERVINANSGGLRLAFRLPTGSRAVHNFAAKDTLTGVFCYIDAQLLEEDGNKESMTASAPALPTPATREEAERAMDAYLATHPSHFRFTLAVAYPRTPIAWAPSVTLDGVRELAGGAQIVVEHVTEKRSGRASGETSRASLAGSRVSLDAASRNGTPVNGPTSGDDDEYLTESDEE